MKLNQKVTYKPISVYPKIFRDLTLLINNNISCDDIINSIQRKSFNYMINSRISDIFYSKKDFGDDKKIMTIELQHFHNAPESKLIPLRDQLKAFN